ncbi:serine hydrolase [Paludibaculum fermentans]|uniref:beta-lactamase n=1 Tax=Paludibaculum fermentans TaxID=1473598 RepID=A0A7S7SIX0_PALFE|nr:serine hydrolase [Paludibaculum fermentans]QOY85911.1 serine hydrolase [Paludibaculum fermentans]
MRRRNFLSLPAMALAPSKDLLDAIRRDMLGVDADISLYAKNLDTGQSFGLRENARVRTASTIKLPIMAAVFHKVARRQLRWDRTLLLRESDKVSGSGVLHEFSAGLHLPLRDVVNVMIVVSDNTATNLILDLITADAVNAFLDTMGLKQTRSMRKVRGDGNQLKAPSGWSKAGLLEENKRFGIGSSTPFEMVSLLERLEKGEVVNAASSRAMLDILKRQQFKDGIGRRMGAMPVASKSGALDALRSDVGIVYTPKGRVALAITVDGLKQIDESQDNPGLLLISRAAQTLCRGLTGML